MAKRLAHDPTVTAVAEPKLATSGPKNRCRDQPNPAKPGSSLFGAWPVNPYSRSKPEGMGCIAVWSVCDPRMLSEITAVWLEPSAMSRNEQAEP